MNETFARELKELAYRLIALAEGVPLPGDESYPKLVTHQGVQYMLAAPLPAGYENGVAAITFGKPPSVVRDPSNAPAGYPYRSAAGWPLSYAIGAGGLPVGEPRMVCGDQTFASDAEVAAYAARLLEVAALRAKTPAMTWEQQQAGRVTQQTAPQTPVDVPIGQE